MKKLTLTYLGLLFIFSACAASNEGNKAATASNEGNKTAAVNAEKAEILDVAKVKKALEDIKMLSAADFPDLPKDIAGYLQKRGCKIPQISNEYNDEPPHNVIKGNFYKKGQQDWAVLCSENGSSTILVFRDGAVKNIHELAKQTDDSYMQVIDGAKGTLGFSRLIATADKNYIKKRDEEFAGNGIAKTIPDNVQGIDDIYVEKASVIHYFRNGKWVELQGRD